MRVGGRFAFFRPARGHARCHFGVRPRRVPMRAGISPPRARPDAFPPPSGAAALSPLGVADDRHGNRRTHWFSRSKEWMPRPPIGHGPDTVATVSKDVDESSISLASAVADRAHFGRHRRLRRRPIPRAARRPFRGRRFRRRRKESTARVARAIIGSSSRDSVARADSLARVERMCRIPDPRADSLESNGADASMTRSCATAHSSGRRSAPTPLLAPRPADTTTTRDTIRSTRHADDEQRPSFGMRPADGVRVLGLGAGPNVRPVRSTTSTRPASTWKCRSAISAGQEPARVRMIVGYPVSTAATRARTVPPRSLTIRTFGRPRQPDTRSAIEARSRSGVRRAVPSRRRRVSPLHGLLQPIAASTQSRAPQGQPRHEGGLTVGAGLSLPLVSASLVESRYHSTAYAQGRGTRSVPVAIPPEVAGSDADGAGSGGRGSAAARARRSSLR